MNLQTRLKIHQLRQKWQYSPDAQRKEIEAEIERLKNADSHRGDVRKNNAREGDAHKGDKKEPASKPASQQSKGSESKKPAIPALEDLPFAQYCELTELIPMVKADKGWMTYSAFREKNPDANVFDLDPNSMAVMYMNWDKYQELPPDQLDEAMSRCVRHLPRDVEPVEIAILNGILYKEAQHDHRIKKLGYKGENMYDFEDNHLFADYYAGIFYNVLHSGMTLEEARLYAQAAAGEEVGSTEGSPKPTPTQPKSKSSSRPTTAPKANSARKFV